MAKPFDPKKSERNVTLPGRADLGFERARDFDFDRALVREDTRPHPRTGLPYPERRFQAIGKIGNTIVMHVYTPEPAPIGFRTISLRTASKKERKAWSDVYAKKPPS